MTTQRIPYLDNIKGILIMLVILGHSIQFCDPGYLQNFGFRFIYSFHMPLFFFISGYLSNRGQWNNKLIKKRALQLLVPFLVWAFLSPLLKSGYITFTELVQRIIYPDKGLWFLYNLFVYSVIFNLAEYIEERWRIRNYISIGCFYLLLCFLMFLYHTKFNCTQLCYHIVFFASGYYSRLIKFNNKHSKEFISALFVFYVLAVPFWVTNGNPLFYDYLNLGGAFAYLYRYGVQIGGMLLFYNIGRIALDKECPVLQKIGASTLGIYAIQFVVLYYFVKIIPIEELVLKIIVVSILSTLTSYMFVYIVRKTKYLKLLLIGEK